MPCAEWYTSVDSRRLSTVELMSKAFLAVDSEACVKAVGSSCPPFCQNTVLTASDPRSLTIF
eukprot:7417734-Pyramimonas_sp.AAC.1